MNKIEWKDGAVCYANGGQWFIDGKIEHKEYPLHCKPDLGRFDYINIIAGLDFQLNEIREGDFIQASELDTEQKYNDVVESLKLHGVTGGLVEDKYSYQNLVGMLSENKLIVIHETENKARGQKEICAGFVNSADYLCKRKMFCEQIIAIGKLKRMVLDKLAKDADDATDKFVNSLVPTYVDVSHHEVVSKFKSYNEAVSEVATSKPSKRNKSKQAYDILKSLDYEYDLVKQKWFKKVYIND